MDYYLGLDMGTSSVGWACTDQNYEILRAKGKDLWGVRLFDEAETAANRRSFRVSRRRLAREKARIGSLKAIFEESVNDIDFGFFERLDDSKLFQEDKREHQPYSLFADKNYTDQDFYQEYPTIFHLRKSLIESEKEFDVRLVYLAILNMFKHRGHFLNANLNTENEYSLSELVDELKEKLLPFGGDESIQTGTWVSVLESYLPSKEFSRSKKAEMIAKELGIDKKTNKSLFEIVKLFCGLKGTITVIFPEIVVDKEKEKFSISFTDANYEEAFTEAEELYQSEIIDILLVIKMVHDWGAVAAVMNGQNGICPYLSFARVEAWEKHQKDLTVLKKLLKENHIKAYNKMFRHMEKNNYSAYVGSTNAHGKQIRRGEKANRDDFYKLIKKEIKSFPESQEKQYVLNEIEKETFLPKQLTSANGVIPNQLHKAELKKILENAENYLPFLKAKDETGLTSSEKIIKLFEFQIPYYVGPLKNDGNGNGWCVRKEEGKVYPWNFEQKIDLSASAEKFIEQLVRRCTYLNDESVLPKSSLLYEKFRVLNELNNLKINGFPISVNLKQEIFNNLFKTGRRITGKRLYQYLVANGHISGDEIITGIDGDFQNTLSTYASFAKILNVETLTDSLIDMAEHIIFWGTVYGDSRKFLKEKIAQHYGNQLSKDQLKKITSLKFKDWGKLSSAMLTMDGYDKENGEHMTIIDRMWQQNVNLMEVLSKAFSYSEEIEKRIEFVEKSIKEIQPEDLDDLYCSSPVKRMIWQTIRIVRELVQVLGEPPKRIFIEMAREDGIKNDRKESRKNKLLALYKKCQEEAIDLDILNQTEESKLKSKKLYLYYLQQGRCMYTGNVIELSNLFNDNLYDIDHIYPRHFVKDDSIENNLVLVQKQSNAIKTDTYPIEANIRKRQHGWWHLLKEKGFITEEKYNRLVRNTPFTIEEQAGFISRQIVETRQGTKAVAQIFKELFDEDQTEIVYVKAGNTSAFRQHFDIIKCREINDFHHAHDAYLNIVTGNTYLVKFTKDPINFVTAYRKDVARNPYHMYRIFDFDVRRGDETAWIAENGESIRIVKKMISKQSPLVTRMTKEVHGGLADQTIYSAKEAKKAQGVGYIPVKSTDAAIADVTKYGGFKKFTGTYFFLVEYTEKGKRIRSLEAMPLYLKEKLNSVEKIQQYCHDTLGYSDPDIRLPKIKMFSELKVNGFPLYLTGRSNDRLMVANAVQLKVDAKTQKYIKRLTKALNETATPERCALMEISREKNQSCYNLFVEKFKHGIFSCRPNPFGEKLSEKRDVFSSLSIEQQIQVLISIVVLFTRVNSGVDLTGIGEPKKAGVMTMHKKISRNDECLLIHRSPCGLFHSQIDLLTI